MVDKQKVRKGFSIISILLGALLAGIALVLFFRYGYNTIVEYTQYRDQVEVQQEEDGSTGNSVAPSNSNSPSSVLRELGLDEDAEQPNIHELIENDPTINDDGSPVTGGDGSISSDSGSASGSGTVPDEIDNSSTRENRDGRTPDYESNTGEDNGYVNRDGRTPDYHRDNNNDTSSNSGSIPNSNRENNDTNSNNDNTGSNDSNDNNSVTKPIKKALTRDVYPARNKPYDLVLLKGNGSVRIKYDYTVNSVSDTIPITTSIVCDGNVVESKNYNISSVQRENMVFNTTGDCVLQIQVNNPTAENDYNAVYARVLSITRQR